MLRVTRVRSAVRQGPALAPELSQHPNTPSPAARCADAYFFKEISRTCALCSTDSFNEPALQGLLLLLIVLLLALIFCLKRLLKLYNSIDWGKLRVVYINFSILTSIPDALGVQFPEPVRGIALPRLYTAP